MRQRHAATRVIRVSGRAGAGWRRCLVTSVAALLGMSACSTPRRICPGLVTTAMVVTVTDAISGLNVCDASLVASDGMSTFGPEGLPMPEAGVTDASCAYAININGAGTKAYTVSVTAPRYKPGLVPDVNVAFDDCGAAENIQAVSIQLLPSP